MVIWLSQKFVPSVLMESQEDNVQGCHENNGTSEELEPSNAVIIATKTTTLLRMHELGRCYRYSRSIP